MTNVCLTVFMCLQPAESEGDVPFRPRTGKAAAAPLIPEVEAYLQLLLVVYLTNLKRYAEVSPEKSHPDSYFSCLHLIDG